MTSRKDGGADRKSRPAAPMASPGTERWTAFVLSDPEMIADLRALLQGRYDTRFYPDLNRMLDDMKHHRFGRIFVDAEIPAGEAAPHGWKRLADAIRAEDPIAVCFLGTPDPEIQGILVRGGIEMHRMESRPPIRQLRGLLNGDPGESG